MLVIFLRKKEGKVGILEFLENPLKGVRKIILSYDYYYKKLLEINEKFLWQVDFKDN